MTGSSAHIISMSGGEPPLLGSGSSRHKCAATQTSDVDAVPQNRLWARSLIVRPNRRLQLRRHEGLAKLWTLAVSEESGRTGANCYRTAIEAAERPYVNMDSKAPNPCGIWALGVEAKGLEPSNLLTASSNSANWLYGVDRIRPVQTAISIATDPMCNVIEYGPVGGVGNAKWLRMLVTNHPARRGPVVRVPRARKASSIDQT